jgi:dolichol-phosphate mannosyltransferase
MFAGIEVAEGEEIILIDGDLQDPPEVISDLIEEKRKGYSIVCGKKIKRKENWLRRNMTALFYILMHFFAQANYPRNVGVFSILDRQTLNWLKKFPETNVHLSGLRHYIGFRQSEVVYERAERSAGDSKSLYQLTRMGLNAFFAFSIFPLRFANFLLLLIASLGLLVLGWSLFSSIFLIDVVQLDHIFNWFYILALVAVALSLVIFSEYIGRTFNMVKNRPLYIIDEIVKNGVVHKYDPILSPLQELNQLPIKELIE